MKKVDARFQDVLVEISNYIEKKQHNHALHLFITAIAPHWEVFARAAQQDHSKEHPDVGMHYQQIANHLYALIDLTTFTNASAPRALGHEAEPDDAVLKQIRYRFNWRNPVQLAHFFQSSDEPHQAEKAPHLWQLGYHFCALAAKSGVENGQADLGNMYLNGIGIVKKDLHEALKWMQPLTEKFSLTTYDVACIHAQLGDYQQQNQYLEQAVSRTVQGDVVYASSRIDLALMYLYGKVVQQDINKALSLLDEVRSNPETNIAYQKSRNKALGLSVMIKLAYASELNKDKNEADEDEKIQTLLENFANIPIVTRQAVAALFKYIPGDKPAVITCKEKLQQEYDAWNMEIASGESSATSKIVNRFTEVLEQARICLHNSDFIAAQQIISTEFAKHWQVFYKQSLNTRDPDRSLHYWNIAVALHTLAFMEEDEQAHLHIDLLKERPTAPQTVSLTEDEDEVIEAVSIGCYENLFLELAEKCKTDSVALYLHFASLAFNWCALAAKRGKVNAIKNVASLYLFGIGVEKNPEAAIKWLMPFADQNAAHLYMLSRAYYELDNVEQEKAYLERALTYATVNDQIYMPIRTKLAGMYLYGRGVSSDAKEALRLLEEAHHSGDHIVACTLAVVKHMQTGSVLNSESFRTIPWDVRLHVNKSFDITHKDSDECIATKTKLRASFNALNENKPGLPMQSGWQLYRRGKFAEVQVSAVAAVTRDKLKMD